MRIGVPSGRLVGHIPAKLRSKWTKVEAGDKSFLGPDRSLQRQRDDDTYFLLRSKTIVNLVALGVLDEGICGSDSLDEFLAPELFEVELVAPQHGVKMVLAAPDPFVMDRALMRPLLVGTSYPATTAKMFDALGKAYIIVEQPGCIEGLCPSLVDVVVDITETGETLRANGLVVLRELGELSVVRIRRRK
jgi:ATP phosphoribosyltransferase